MCLRLPTVRPLARQHTEFQCTPCSQDSVADLLQDVHLDQPAHKMTKAEKQNLKKRLAKLMSAAKSQLNQSPSLTTSTPSWINWTSLLFLFQMRCARMRCPPGRSKKTTMLVFLILRFISWMPAQRGVSPSSMTKATPTHWAV